MAKTNLERQKQLYDAGVISKSQLETYESQASDTQLQPAQVAVDQAKLSLQQAQDSLNNAVVTAPSDGTVGSVNVKVGEMASNTQAAVTLTKLDAIYVSFGVPENMVNFIQVGQDAKVNVTSAGTNELKGKVSSIAPAADPKTQLYAVKVSIDNPNDQIKPGMFAKVQLPTRTKANVIAVNSEAVVTKNGNTYVYVVENNTAVQKAVTTGLDTGALVEISKGLNAGEKVIVKGQNLVNQGSKVKVVGGSAS